MWEKQSSMWFQAKTARSTLKRNLFFNGPRAGINFNDGFGGGDEVAENLIFNTCRESGDHGPINSWDRQPYLTTVRTGEASIVPEYRNIHHNFIVANYNGFKGVDNDDGSSWYKISFNFMVGGWMHKSNYGGIMKHTFGNLGAYVTMGMRMQAPQFPDWVDSFYNNTLIMKAKGAVTYAEVGVVKDKCPEADCWQIMGNNSVFTDAISPEVHTENKGPDYGFDNWLALGHDAGTTLTKSLPTASTIISWARDLLSIRDGSSAPSLPVLLV